MNRFEQAQELHRCDAPGLHRFGVERRVVFSDELGAIVARSLSFKKAHAGRHDAASFGSAAPECLGRCVPSRYQSTCPLGGDEIRRNGLDPRPRSQVPRVRRNSKLGEKCIATSGLESEASSSLGASRGCPRAATCNVRNNMLHT